ncbi:MAG: cell envelope integrity protein CreD [Pseudomonadales bacterium]
MNRSLLLKFVSIGLIAVLILIPLMMIEFKISERAQLRHLAEQSVARSWTGAQRVSGPMIAIDYERTIKIRPADADGFHFDTVSKLSKATRYISPDSTSISARINTEQRIRGIYPFNVYTSTIDFEGVFDVSAIDNAKREIALLHGAKIAGPVRLVWPVSDPRGLNSVSTLSWNSQELELKPGLGGHNNGPGLHLAINGELSPDTLIPFKLQLELRGMHSLQIAPTAKNNHVSMASAWPHPKYTGAFLPIKQSTGPEGFSAQWSVNEFATGNIVDSIECETSACRSSAQYAFGVELIDPIDVYLQSERAVKYGFLFVLLTFVAFIMFELLAALAVHPVQYGLVGLSVATFFLLLISLSEHIAFASAYFIAALASVALLTVYVRNILGSWPRALLLCAGHSGLFALLFVIIQSEDYALLMGSSLCFAVLAAVMLFTRRIDWYSIGRSSDIDYKATQAQD